jgi:hypothetical protein
MVTPDFPIAYHNGMRQTPAKSRSGKLLRRPTNHLPDRGVAPQIAIPRSLPRIMTFGISFGALLVPTAKANIWERDYQLPTFPS